MTTTTDETVVLEDGPIVEAVRKSVVEMHEAGDVNPDEPILDECFIIENDRVVSSGELMRVAIQKHVRGFGEYTHDEKDNELTNTIRQMVEKTAGSTQSANEVGQHQTMLTPFGLKTKPIVEPPYPALLLSTFLEVDETHYRCVKTKVTDSVCRPYTIERRKKMRTPRREGMDPDQRKKMNDELIDRVNAEVEIVENFLEECNDISGFKGVMTKASMDHEAIGWGAIEVIRSMDFKARRIAHAPASRMAVLRNWVGFVEMTKPQKLVYYQQFGNKVVSKRRKDPLTGLPEPYNPREDGPLTAENVEWNLVHKHTGEPTKNLSEAANEIVWIPKYHSNTIYYGYADVIPSLGHLLMNVHIRDYGLQYFEHNTIPRYAIIIEGAKIAQPVKEMITEYFSTHIKGQAHKTLIIPVPSIKGEVKIRFEKLTSDTMEASFQETRKNNAQGIMVSHGVSPAIIGINDSASLGSGKGLSQAEIYKDRIVTPSQEMWEDKVNRVLKLGLGVQTVALKYDPLDIRDREMEMKVLTGYLEKGSTTINEIRLALSKEPIEGGDRAFIVTPSGVIFIDELTIASSADKQALEDEIESMKEDQVRKDMMDKVVQAASNDKSLPRSETKAITKKEDAN